MKLIVLVLALLAGTTVAAHHSYTAFDRQNAVTLEGTLRAVAIRNPHTMLELVTTADERYRIEWAAATNLAQWSVDATVLKPGDRIVITGYILKDRTNNVMSLVRMIRRVDDGWQWGEPPRYGVTGAPVR